MIRRLAYNCLLAAFKEELFLVDSLAEIRAKGTLSKRDFALLETLCYGTMRRALTLDFYGKQLAASGKLKLKLKERVLLRLALFQHLYLDKIPLHAIAFEMVKVAKEVTHPQFVKFLNATLRKLETFTFKEPTALSDKLSAPQYLIDELSRRQSREEIEAFFAIFNHPPEPMMRERGGDITTFIPFDPSRLDDETVYTQNPTPATLMATLAKGMDAPQKILDLCAAPGGKLLLLHDLFPKAELYACDPSEKRLERLRANCKKYGLNPHIACCKGEEYSAEGGFDLIVIDAPCSNSGVLHKRAEARYRIDKHSLDEQCKLQLILLRHAATLLNDGGEIWYMTCSILDRENEDLIKKVAPLIKPKGEMVRILPNLKGGDGGFASSLGKGE